MHYKLFEMKIVEENTKFLEILATCLGRVLDSPLSVGTLKVFKFLIFIMVGHTNIRPTQTSSDSRS